MCCEDFRLPEGGRAMRSRPHPAVPTGWCWTYSGSRCRRIIGETPHAEGRLPSQAPGHSAQQVACPASLCSVVRPILPCGRAEARGVRVAAGGQLCPYPGVDVSASHARSAASSRQFMASSREGPAGIRTSHSMATARTVPRTTLAGPSAGTANLLSRSLRVILGLASSP
jgi:hypothetical protein